MKLKKVIRIIFLILIIGIIFSNCSYVMGLNVNDKIPDIARNWIQEGNNNKPNNMGDTTYWGVLAGVLWGAGVWIAVISGIILGIRFMISDPDKKAEIKKALVVYTVGVVVVLGALSIWRIVIDVLDIV
ncbi:MAG: hypothetical protein HFJ17_01020 [Clostridia bacterium]|nr:hypothetical protein [Clostridia bacterium]